MCVVYIVLVVWFRVKQVFIGWVVRIDGVSVIVIVCYGCVVVLVLYTVFDCIGVVVIVVGVCGI